MSGTVDLRGSFDLVGRFIIPNNPFYAAPQPLSPSRLTKSKVERASEYARGMGM